MHLVTFHAFSYMLLLVTWQRWQTHQ